MKDTIYEDYSVEIWEENEEGMLALILTDKWSDFKCMLFCVYLAPENSVYGNNTYDKFEYLVSSMDDINDVDLIFIGGDLNARLGKMHDFIEGIDDVSERVIIDDTPNDHGKLFNDFLLQTKMCIINGRVNPLRDNYTSISHKGKAVVDYFLTEYNTMSNITDFEVITMANALERFHLLGEAEGRVSEHSIVKTTVDESYSK